jgi:hypothetical protein
MTTLDTHHARTRTGRIRLHLTVILRALAGILREVFLFF